MSPPVHGAMRRPAHRPGAGILLLLVMSAFGAVAGLLVEPLAWLFGGPNRGADQMVARMGQNLRHPGGAAATFAIVGAMLAFILTGLVRGTFRNLGITVGTLVALFVGGLVGAAIGAGSFLFLWADRMGLPQPAPALLVIQDALQHQPLGLFAFAAVGATVAIAVTAFIVNNRAVQTLAGAFIGLMLGAVAGTMLYAAASVLLENQWRSPAWFLLIGQTVSAFTPLEGAFAVFGAGAGFVVARNRWNFYGIVTFVSLLAVIGGFLTYSLFVTLPKVEPRFLWFAWILFSAEAVSLAMVLLYSFYTIDVSSRTEWRRGPAARPHSPFYVPKVAFQVPSFNEPPELVFESLEALMRIDYPKDRYVIMVLDDSTDETSRKPLEEYSNEHGLVYIHRTDRRGFKAGALNHCLPQVPDDVDLFAVIDADYQVRPDYLKETVGYFVDPGIGWVQTPQDYRNPHQSFLTEQYYLADAYFYRTVMPSRNEENAIIFAGTMGIVRKQALLEAGGWGEKYITEDAELSLRLLLRGYSSIYINKTYGRGLIPATFDGYKKQHYRWAFGGGKILRGHLHHLLFGRLTRRQSFDYFVGTIHWIEGLFILLLAFLLMTIGAGELFGFKVATHHSQEVLMVGLIPFFVLADGLTRLHTVMRGSLRLTIGKTMRVLGMWFSVKFSNARAAGKAVLGFNIPFVRTPKSPNERIPRAEAVRLAFKVARFETLLAIPVLLLWLGLGGRLLYEHATRGVWPAAQLFLMFWLFYYLLVFASAPFYAYKSYVTFRPDDDVVMSAPAAQAPAGASGGQ